MLGLPMSPSAERLTRPALSGAVEVYEQPLTERMRTYLRLEFLYRQLRFHLDRPSPWDSRAVLAALLDTIAILTRGDVRSDVLKELERQLQLFDRLQKAPQVDEKRLAGLLRNLRHHREELMALGPQYLRTMRENEFLNAVKHRSAIPGGTCEFDLPDYTHWLRLPYEQRCAAVDGWLKPLRPLCEGVAELLWLMRESGEAVSAVAQNGIYQHTLRRDSASHLLRVSLSATKKIYPEISASHHRFTLRFMKWPTIADRAVQVTEDVPFEIKVC
jgi:cell division protein ZapD